MKIPFKRMKRAATTDPLARYSCASVCPVCGGAVEGGGGMCPRCRRGRRKKRKGAGRW